MLIHIVPNRKAAPTVLLRESYRQGHKVCARTGPDGQDLSKPGIPPAGKGGSPNPSK